MELDSAASDLIGNIDLRMLAVFGVGCVLTFLNFGSLIVMGLGLVLMLVGGFIVGRKLPGLVSALYTRETKGRALWVDIKSTLLTSLDYVDSVTDKPPFPKEIYKKVPIFPFHGVTERNAFNEVKGNYKTVAYSLINLETFHESKNKDDRTVRKLVFRGLLFTAKFNKRFNSTTVVQTDKAEQRLGSMGRNIQKLKSSFSDLKVVELETPAFEKCFLVRSSDPVEARYILSLNFMEQMLTLKEKWQVDFQVCFKDGEMLMSIPTPENFLDNRRRMTDPMEQVKALVTDMQNVLYCVDVLELDERIWTQDEASGM